MMPLVLRPPNPKEEKDLYNPLIPPIPAFLKAISVLMILAKNRTSTKTPSDIGNGKIKVG
jgi:hypothetical protein